MAYGALLERTVALSRARVYALLADFGNVGRLVPDEVGDIKVKGEGVGMVRMVSLKAAPGELHERLEALVENRLVSYSMVNDAALPIDRYHAVVDLADAPGGGCTIRWGSNWFARGAPEADVREMLTGLYGRLIDGIVRVG